MIRFALLLMLSFASTLLSSSAWAVGKSHARAAAHSRAWRVENPRAVAAVAANASIVEKSRAWDMKNSRNLVAENSNAWAVENPRSWKRENARTSAAENSYAWAPQNPRTSAVENPRDRLQPLIASYASANGIPESLVHRVIMRESRYNPSVIGRGGAMGLMQIKTATARELGYSGSASGLLDAETNLTYAVRYLAGAYQVAGGDENRAVSYYARGYYYAAKRQRAQVEGAGRHYRS